MTWWASLPSSSIRLDSNTFSGDVLRKIQSNISMIKRFHSRFSDDSISYAAGQHSMNAIIEMNSFKLAMHHSTFHTTAATTLHYTTLHHTTRFVDPTSYQKNFIWKEEEETCKTFIFCVPVQSIKSYLAYLLHAVKSSNLLVNAPNTPWLKSRHEDFHWGWPISFESK